MEYIRSNRLNQRDYKYISDVHDVMGVSRDTQVIFVGTYYWRKDFDEIAYMIEVRNLERVFP